MAPKPESFQELFEFYREHVKPLYSTVQLTNNLPVEILFEINAAFDHLSRYFGYNEPEDHVCEKAYSHLKRSCLDVFKLAVKKAIDQFNELRKIDTSVIDNGEFDRKLIALYTKIKEGAKHARQEEGNTTDDNVHEVRAFELWGPVYEDCILLEKEFYSHNSLNWAKKKEAKGKWTERFYGFVFGVLAGLLVWLGTEQLPKFFSAKPAGAHQEHKDAKPTESASTTQATTAPSASRPATGPTEK